MGVALPDSILATSFTAVATTRVAMTVGDNLVPANIGGCAVGDNLVPANIGGCVFGTMSTIAAAGEDTVVFADVADLGICELETIGVDIDCALGNMLTLDTGWVATLMMVLIVFPSVVIVFEIEFAVVVASASAEVDLDRMVIDGSDNVIPLPMPTPTPSIAWGCV